MEKKKTIPFEAVMAFVMMVITTAIAVDGLFVHKLTAAALRYPLFCCGVIYICGIVEIVKALSKMKAEEGKEAKPIHKNGRNWLIMCGLLIAYLLIMYVAGFIVSSICLFGAFVYIFKGKKPLLSTLLAAVVIVAIYVVFKKQLYIFLPKGLLFKRVRLF